MISLMTTELQAVVGGEQFILHDVAPEISRLHFSAPPVSLSLSPLF